MVKNHQAAEVDSKFSTRTFPCVSIQKSWMHNSNVFGQIIATSHDLTPNVGGNPLFQGNLGWWNIIIWPDNSCVCVLQQYLDIRKFIISLDFLRWKGDGAIWAAKKMDQKLFTPEAWNINFFMVVSIGIQLDDSKSLHRKWLEITKHPSKSGCFWFQA